MKCIVGVAGHLTRMPLPVTAATHEETTRLRMTDDTIRLQRRSATTHIEGTRRRTSSHAAIEVARTHVVRCRRPLRSRCVSGTATVDTNIEAREGACYLTAVCASVFTMRS